MRILSTESLSGSGIPFPREVTLGLSHQDEHLAHDF